MSLIDIKLDLERVARALERLADAAERAYPPLIIDTEDHASKADFSEPSESGQYESDLKDAQAEGK